MAMVVMLVSLQLTALAVVREKEIGTLEQLLVSPIRPLELLLGKTVPFVIISLVDVVLVIIVAMFWFEVPFRGNPSGPAAGHHPVSSSAPWAGACLSPPSAPPSSRP